MDRSVKDQPAAAGSRLGRESAAAGLGSFVALGVGLLLELSLAFLLGADSETDALFVALRIPLGVAVFFPPTAIQVLVPVMTRWLDGQGTRATNAQTTGVFAGTFLLSTGLSIGGILAAPVLMPLLAPGLSVATQQLAAELARIAFLMVPMIASSEVLRAYRHARRTHGMASALHSLSGITIVTVLLVSLPNVTVRVAVWAYVAGALVQLVGAWLMARTSGFSFVRGSIMSRETRAIGAMAMRPLGASGIQLGMRLIEQMVASFLAPGSITILTYANRLASAVGGTLFFRPITTAFLVPMSLLHASGDVTGIRGLLRRGLRLMLGISASLTVLVVVAGTPFVAGMFAMGDLSADQAWLVGIAVATYALSFPFAALQRMLLGVSFAGLDTRAYLRNTIFGAVANVALLFAMYFFWQPRLEILIVPIAYGMAQAVNVWHAAVVVRHDVGPPFAGVSRGGLRFAVVLLVTLGAMLAVLIPLSRGLTGSPITLVVAGIASALVGMFALAVGSMWVAPTEVRGFLKRSQKQPVTSPANRADD